MTTITKPVTKSVKIGDQEFSIEVNRIARQADGACMVRFGETVVLVTALADRSPREGIPFLPLTVDYREKSSAAGKIPGGFFKREGRPTEREILTCRIIDRSIRPMFKKGWNFELQAASVVFSADPFNPPDVIAATGASVAFCLSDIPFDGPLATIRIGRVDGQFIANPTFEQIEQGDIDLVVTASESAINMVEGLSDEISEQEMIDALLFGFDRCKPLIEIQKELVAELGKQKREFHVHEVDEQLADKVKNWAFDEIKEALSNQEKLPRYRALSAVKKEILAKAQETFPETLNLGNDVEEVLDGIKRDIVRGDIAGKGIRLDGRDVFTVRPIEIQLGLLPRAHGSALFTRGETQALVTTTLGTSRDEQLIENLEKEYRSRFMLHYNFPPFSVGEVKPIRGPGRREIGHGKLAERAVQAILPMDDDFPYTVRIVSDITESNGSSSMATICGGCLSLMDAGVDIKKPVAGVAMGLIKEGDDFLVLTDILGDEDHLGDMDFKVGGTKDGITAIQMDIKIKGIDRVVLEKALAQANDARLHILGEMDKAITAPREEMSRYAPRIHTLKVKPDRIRDIIGPGGRVIKEIVAQTGCSIDVEDDGTVKIGSSDPEATKQALQMIKELTQEAEEGKLYMSTVKKIMDFGAFCEIFPGTDGLLHISEMSDKRIDKVTDLLREGDEVLVKCIGIDRQGKIRLSRKEALNQQAE
jgi:polyribonucleotide nucleotidyltransferase